MGALGQILLIVLLAAADGAPSKQQTGEAKAAFIEGKRQYNIGHWRTALEAFQKAYTLSGDPALLFNIAQAHRQAGDLGEALTAYRSFLRERPDAPNRELVEARIADLEAQLKVAKVKEPTVAPELAKPDKPDKATPPPTTVLPPVVPPPPPTVVVVTQPGSTATTPPPSASSGRWLAWTGVGATALAATGAIIAGLSVNSRYDSLVSTCGGLPDGCSSSQVDGVRSRVLLTNILWGVTGVLAVGTGLTFYFTGHESGIAATRSF